MYKLFDILIVVQLYRSRSFICLQKLCKDCGRYFCANCVMQLQENVKKSHRQCKKCNILTSGRFTRQDLQKWKVKDLRCVLHKRNISTETCREKHDLIDLLVITFGVVSQNNSEERSSSSSQSAVSFSYLIVWVISLSF